MNPLPENPPLDLRELFRVLSRRRMLMIAPWAAAVLVGVLAAFLLRPIYFSSVTLLLKRPQVLAGQLSGMVNGGNPEQQAEVMREQVQSTLFLQGVITATGLVHDPEARAWALKESKGYPYPNPDERIEAFLIDYLRQAIAIKRGKGDVFQVTVGDYRPERAKQFADAVAHQFVMSSKAQQLATLDATQQFSTGQQNIYRQKLEESEGRLQAARRGQLASQMSSASGGVSDRNLAHARSLLDQAALDIDEQRQRVSSLKQELRGKVRDNDPGLLSSPETNSMQSQLNGLERQLASSTLIADGDGDGFSARQALARKISELELEFMQNAAIALPGATPDVRDLLVRYRLAQADLGAKEARRAYLGGQVGGYEQRVVMTPDRDTELQRLTNEVETNRALYQSFLQQSSATQIAEAFENAKIGGRFEILEPAALPRSPGKPNRPLLILLSLVVGGVIGIGSVLVVEQHDQSMKNAEEVENLLGLPVLGAVPRVEELERSGRRGRQAPVVAGPGLTAPRDPGLLQRLKIESPLGLEFRRIYLKLAKTRGRSLPTTILVTSSTRGEGKTTTSACLAITLARELRERVLLVDFDLRSPSLHRALGLPTSSWGLAQMLGQRHFDERFVRSTVMPTLDFLAAGKSERPASELIDTEAVEWFLREARSRYPVVILDAAPNLAVPDPLILGRSVEGVMYVVKAGSTIRKAAEYGVKVQREARDNVLGVLLNDAGEILPHYYGYHDAYGSEVVGGES